ncbi:hypothetical protein [Nocardiopsis algeriensis]|uniref:Uncharacterized protein n=1 Tax=Nocardiopsis algeriensis TaxID=1478215 RepID=A0A841IKR3_9ACTN|nr:hypothetical protein [Nocardiopsis algeriensis]MBB6118574.1 hypothetical protein [Nocardiopsis algeriensis]
MLQFVPPNLTEHPLVLAPDEAYRGPAGPLPPSGPPSPSPTSERGALTERVFLGGPVSVPITPEYTAGDPALKAFVEREAGHSTYHLVHLSVSFANGPGLPPLRTASVELKLSSASGVRPPVAWSMSPLRVDEVSQVQQTFHLGPELKFQDVEVALGGYEASRSAARTAPFLLGMRELRDDPGWEFTRTRTMALDGTHRLVLVVRAERGGTAGVTGTVRATTRGNLLRRYRSALPRPLTLSTVL